VRGTSERQFLIRQSKRISRATFDERNGLNGFQRRAGKDRALDISQTEPQASLRIGHGDRAAMDAFDEGPSCDLDKNGIGHDASNNRSHPSLSSGMEGPEHFRAKCPARLARLVLGGKAA
jgi:hypothetical protein